MPIYIKSGKELSALNIGRTVQSAVYVGVNLIWQAIRSCFGSGFWVNQKPWLNNESWKNNN